MRIYLVQHALALDEAQDPKRGVSTQGREDVVRTAGFLSLFEKPKPVHVFHSGKLRAQQTAEMFAEAWHLKNDIMQADDLSPNANPEVWAAKLNAMKDDVLIVGHLPHLPRLVSLLLCGDTDTKPVRFQNAGVVCLEKDDDGYQVVFNINPTMFYEGG
ncbi:MAG TPA: phosphohistidine phosphatase SixA [Mariprofundaceae bacterium]|nr:phosphohistidine phosphatase SixA [Mariprofundaceae bacterium]